MESVSAREGGTQKKEVEEAVLKENWGIEGDAHAGDWHRQVSLLSFEKIEDFRARAQRWTLEPSGRTLIVEGYNLRRLPVGTRFHIGEAVLELTQIGKECHSHCEIYKKMGDCIMPREGVFTEVVKGGRIHRGDAVEMELPAPDRPFTAAVITLSDKGATGEREDKSGPLTICELEQAGYEVKETAAPCGRHRAVKEPAHPPGGPAADGCDLHHRRHRIFREGLNAGGNDRRLRPDGRRDRGRHPQLLLTITPRAMFSRAVSGIRGEDSDRQSAGQS